MVAQLLDQGHDTFLEIAPHPVLSGSISQCLHERAITGTVLPSLRREGDDRAVLLGSLGALYSQGHPVDWKKVYPHGRHVRIPGYVWQRERCWIEEEQEGASQDWGAAPSDRHPLLTRHVHGAHARHHHIWETELDRRRLPYLSDHRLQGAIIVPGAAFVEMALAACAEAFGNPPYVLEDTNLHKALILPEKGSRTVQIVFNPDLLGTITFQIFSRVPETEGAAAQWTLHAEGKVRPNETAHPGEPVAIEALKAAMEREKTARRLLRGGQRARPDLWPDLPGSAAGLGSGLRGHWPGPAPLLAGNERLWRSSRPSRRRAAGDGRGPAGGDEASHLQQRPPPRPRGQHPLLCSGGEGMLELLRSRTLYGGGPG